MKNKVLILGKGFVGARLKEAFDCGISGRRIRSIRDAEEEIRKYNPKILINCIGRTGKRNVDDCEIDKNTALFSNAFVPVILAEAAIRHKIKLIHVSSGCVYRYDYSKNRPVKEEKIPDFFELFYSRSKIYAEGALKALADKHNTLIVRLRIPLDSRPHPKNILDKLIACRKVTDIPNSLTYIPDFIKALKHLIRINAGGIYNVVNKGSLRYPELLDVYKKYVPDFNYKVIDYKKLNLIRTNLILSTRKLEKTGFKPRKIQDVLKECVENYLKY